MKELYLKGSFYAMGKEYGRRCKKEIAGFAKMVYFMVSICTKPGSTPFSPKLRHVLPTLLGLRKKKTTYRELTRHYEVIIKEYYPQALEMIKGIAEGAGVDYETILFMNVSLDEMMHCSIWGASGGSTKTGGSYIGMNADEEKKTLKYEVMLHLEPDEGFSIKMQAMAGMVLPNNGMNETGLAWAGIALFLKSQKAKRFSPIVFAKVLHDCSTVEEVKAYYESLPFLDIGYCIYVADKDSFMKVECSPQNTFCDVYQDGSIGICNIPEYPETLRLDMFSDLPDNKNMNAKHRTKRMQKLLQEHDGQIDQGIMHKIASDHGEEEDGTYYKSMCQHPDKAYGILTCASYIANPAEKRFWVYEGSPCENRVREYSF